MVEENSTNTVDQPQTESPVENKGATKAQTLTKRNEDFIFQLKKHLTDKMDAQQLDTEIATITEALLAGQLTGATAKQLYGTPSEAAANLLNPKARQAAMPNGNNAGYWANALDTALLFLAMFGAVFGFFMLFNHADVKTTGAPYGIVSLIITAVVGGLIFAYIQDLLVPRAGKVKKPFWYRLIAMLLAIVLWMLIYMGVAFIPRAVNPILPGFAYIVIAVIAFAAFIYERRVTGITGGFFGGPSPKK